MNNIEMLKKRYELFAWGALFILFGVLSIIPGDQTGEFYLGAGVILLGLNLIAFYAHKVPINWFWSFVGIVAIFIGTVGLLSLHLGIPIFEIFLVAFGVALLIRAITGKR